MSKKRSKSKNHPPDKWMRARPDTREADPNAPADSSGSNKTGKKKGAATSSKLEAITPAPVMPIAIEPVLPDPSTSPLEPPPTAAAEQPRAADGSAESTSAPSDAPATQKDHQTERQAEPVAETTEPAPEPVVSVSPSPDPAPAPVVSEPVASTSAKNESEIFATPFIWKKAPDYFSVSAELTASSETPVYMAPQPVADQYPSTTAQLAPSQTSTASTVAGQGASEPPSIESEYHSFEEAAMQFLKSRGVSVQPTAPVVVEPAAAITGPVPAQVELAPASPGPASAQVELAPATTGPAPAQVGLAPATTGPAPILAPAPAPNILQPFAPVPVVHLSAAPVAPPGAPLTQPQKTVNQEAVSKDAASVSPSGTNHLGHQEGNQPALADSGANRSPGVDGERGLKDSVRTADSSASSQAKPASQNVRAPEGIDKNQAAEEEEDWRPVGKLIDPKLIDPKHLRPSPLSPRSNNFVEQMRKAVGSAGTPELPQERELDESEISGKWNRDVDDDEEIPIPARPLMPAAPLRKQKQQASTGEQKLSLEERMLAENIQSTDMSEQQLKVQRLKEKTTTGNAHLYLMIYAVCLVFAYLTHQLGTQDIRDIASQAGRCVNGAVSRLMVPNVANVFGTGLSQYEDEDTRALNGRAGFGPEVSAGLQAAGKVASGEGVAGGRSKRYWFSMPTGFWFGWPAAGLYVVHQLWNSNTVGRSTFEITLIFSMYAAILILSVSAYMKLRRFTELVPSIFLPVQIFILMAIASVIIWAVLSFSLNVFRMMSDTVQAFTSLAVIIIAAVAVKSNFVGTKRRPRDPRLG